MEGKKKTSNKSSSSLSQKRTKSQEIEVIPTGKAKTTTYKKTTKATTKATTKKTTKKTTTFKRTTARTRGTSIKEKGLANLNNFFKSIKTGSDFVYRNHFQNKKMQIMERLSYDYKNDFNNNLNLDIARILLILLDINYNICFSNDYNDNDLRKTTGGRRRRKNNDDFNHKNHKNHKKNSRKMKGGAVFDNYSDLTKYYFLNQYIFDNNHDFGTEFGVKSDDPSNSFGKPFLYTKDDINAPPVIRDELLKLFEKDEKDIFYDFISKDFTLSSRIVYFSIFDFVNLQIKDLIGKSIFVGKNPAEIRQINENIKRFIETIIGHNSKFITDCNLSKGVIDVSRITNAFRRLNIPINFIDDVIRFKADYNGLVENFNNYLLKEGNRIITLEDCYDPAGIKKEDAEKFFKMIKTKGATYLFAYITNLIGGEGFPPEVQIPDVIKEAFKSFNSSSIKLFSCVYYEKRDELKPAFIFKNSSIMRLLIEQLKPVIQNFDIIKLTFNQTTNIYEETLVTSSGFDYYAYDLIKIRQFNSVANIKKIINEIIGGIAEKGSLRNFITTSNLNQFNTRDLFIVLYCYMCFLIEMGVPSQQDLFSVNLNSNPEIHKKVARVFFDFKNVGDLSKILVVFYYNYLNDLPIPALNQAKINVQTNLIPAKLHFSSNDKLTTLGSILRKTNTVCYSDLSSFSIGIYNHSADVNIDLSKLFTWFAIRFNSKFLPDNFNNSILSYLETVISGLDETNNYNRFIFYLNNLFKIALSNPSIDLRIKDNNENKFKRLITEIGEKGLMILISANDYSILRDLILTGGVNEESGISYYVKMLFDVYLNEVKKQVQMKLLSPSSINYFTTKIFFNKINLDTTKLHYQLFYIIVQKYMQQLIGVFSRLIDLISAEIKATEFDLTDANNIEDTLIKVETIIKIIELFLFKEDKVEGAQIETEEPQTTGKKRKATKAEAPVSEKREINNIFDFYEDLSSFVSQIIYYKYITDVNYEEKQTLRRGLTKPAVSFNPKQKLNIYSMTFAPFLLNDYIKDIFNVKLDDETAENKNQINFIRRMQSLFNSLFININIINYIASFQKFNDHFNQILSSDFKFLGASLNPEITQYLNLFIYYIKKIYYYSFIQIYSLGYYDPSGNSQSQGQGQGQGQGTENELLFFFRMIKTTIATNISSVASSTTFKNKNQREVGLTGEQVADNIKIGDEMINEIFKRIDDLAEKLNSFNLILPTNLNAEQHKNLIIYKKEVIQTIRKTTAVEPIQAIQITLQPTFTENQELLGSLIAQFSQPEITKINLEIIQGATDEDFIKIINIYNYLLLNENPFIVSTPSSGGGRRKKK